MEVLEGDIGYKEDDDMKDVSEFEGDGKGFNDDY